MAAFPKADPAAVAEYESLLPDDPRVERRRMFGHPCAFVSGNMFMGVFGDGVFVRLGPEDRAILLAEDGAAPFDPMGGRPMREYVTLPSEWRDEPAAAEQWVARSLTYMSSLPPKVKKPGKGRTR
ncbi:MAG: TfoX/Sxy family protein [Proteobacteria bacterium]|nr:TfoX/Sxy family protein [Pseudomonadota bacterium]